MLVYYETFSKPSEAIEREKEIKGWRREKKLRLILAANPDWADLSTERAEDESWNYSGSEVSPGVAPAATQKLRAAGADSSALLAR